MIATLLIWLAQLQTKLYCLQVKELEASHQEMLEVEHNKAQAQLDQVRQEAKEKHDKVCTDSESRNGRAGFCAPCKQPACPLCRPWQSVRRQRGSQWRRLSREAS